jgi:hypothetical protein|nr:MAG TPA: hypothetical protein [Caudoviricetes sp.]
MYEVPCLNLNGDTINRFYQWDIDQKIVIDLNGCDERYLQNPPEVHFSNSSRKEALVVRSTVKYSGDDVAVQDDSVATMHAGDIIIADIPNILLQEPYPLLVYVYLTDADDSSSQKTILYSEIPVRKRAKPSDYLYVENITRITAEMIKKEIEASTETARTNAINEINNVKTKSVATVTDTRDTAVNTITQTKTNAVSTVDEAKEGFIATGNGLVNTATEIKNNTQKTYDNAVSVANKTQQTIETNINTLITKNGVYLKTVNDGNGNANLAILVNQS